MASSAERPLISAESPEEDTPSQSRRWVRIRRLALAASVGLAICVAAYVVSGFPAVDEPWVGEERHISTPEFDLIFRRHSPKRSDEFVPLQGYELARPGTISFKLPSQVQAANELFKVYPVQDHEELFTSIPHEDIEALFQDFLVTFGSTAGRRERRTKFDSEEEYRHRLAVFSSNLAGIIERNARAQAHATRPDHARFGITIHADWTKEEFGKLLSKLAVPKELNGTLEKKAKLPRTTQLLDFPCSGAVVAKEARQQGQCGDCWAYSTAATLRYDYFFTNSGETSCEKQTGGTCYVWGCDASRDADCVDHMCVCGDGKCASDGACTSAHVDVGQLSAEYLVDCDPDNTPECSDGVKGCCGGWPSKAMEWLASSGGLPSREDYGAGQAGSNPFTDYQCKADTPKTITLDGPYSCTDEQDMVNTFCNHGALSIAVAADVWSSYTGGVLTADDCPGDYVDHAVELVGVDPSLNVWIVRNSWGDEWGVAAVPPYPAGGGNILLSAGEDTCLITAAAVAAMGTRLAD